MIVGIGCDIVDHELTRDLKWAQDKQFLEKHFTEKEIALVPSQREVRFISGRFAVKEAVLKALGTGMCDGMALKEIEILQTEDQKPTISLSGNVAEISKDLGVNSWHITISHSPNCSCAFVVAERV